MRRGELRIEGLGKRYWFRSTAPTEDEEEDNEEDEDDDGGGSGPQSNFASLFGRRAEIWALRDLFCHIEPGQRVAVIGANGAGKSTLIRILARTLPPSEGTVEGAGMVVPFAALSGALSGQQSGCDNLRMLARLLALSPTALEDHLPEIVEFSELGALAHEQVFRYSSKSFARLALAMALCIDADIYLIDDGFGAGDQIYQMKVQAKFQEVLNRNRTLIYASNNLRELKLYCQRALWLDGGKLVADGDFDTVAEQYLANNRRLTEMAKEAEKEQAPADTFDLESPSEEVLANPAA